MSCRELVEVVTDYLEGAIPVRDRLRLEAHLVRCHDCLNYLGQVRETIALVAKLDDEPLEPETRARLLGAFRNWSAGA